MTNTWSTLASTHGRKSVMSLAISDAQLDAETKRQADVIFPMIAPLVMDHEYTALDFGCGAGRFTPHLHAMMGGDNCKAFTMGYDPCCELVEQAPRGEGIAWSWGNVDSFFPTYRYIFNVVFVAMVLGDPNLDVEATAAGLVSVMSPRGLLVLVDHMVEEKDHWWKFRDEGFYVELFGRHGVALEKIGEDRQLDNKIHVLAGRRGGVSSPGRDNRCAS